MNNNSRKQFIGAKALILAFAASTALAGAGFSAAADPNHHDGGDHAGWGQDYGGGHSWKSGERIGYNDWSGAQPVDYRQHRLRHPPRGYEWRESNGQYVLAAVATGVIASIVMGRDR